MSVPQGFTRRLHSLLTLGLISVSGVAMAETEFTPPLFDVPAVPQNSIISEPITPTASAENQVPPEDDLDVKIRNGWAVVAQQARGVADRSDRLRFPTTTTTDVRQAWNYSLANDWGSGFYPGIFWILEAQFSGDWLQSSLQWQEGMKGQATDTSTHDVGFKVFPAFRAAYDWTGNDQYKQTVLTAAQSLSKRYNATVGATRSWGSISDTSNFQVIMDNMLNIETMFWAARHGGPSNLFDQARNHALSAAKNHVREDGSSYHLVNYDPVTGSVKSRQTVQGYSNESTWARGQAWGIYGFTMTYRYTREPIFLDTARKMADYYIAHLPSDKVPYWDFNAPNETSGAPPVRDSSAGAIAVAGLLELSVLEKDPLRSATYLTAAKEGLSSLLSTPYLAMLKGASVLNSNSQAVLLESAYHKKNSLYNQGTSWGDFYLAQALERYRRIKPELRSSPIAATQASAAQSENPASNATDSNLSTRWSAEGDNQWLQIDLGNSEVIHKIGVAFYLGDSRTAAFDLDTSVDGVTWNKQLSARSSGTTNAMEYYDIPDQTARYVRLVGHGNTASKWNSVTELAAF